MLSHAWAFSHMGLLFRAWIGSLTYAFSRMIFFTYECNFSRLDWVSHVYFLTHVLFHIWFYFFTHGLGLSRMLSHAWAFSRMGVIFHAWNQICVRCCTAHDNSTSGTQHFRFKLLYETLKCFYKRTFGIFSILLVSRMDNRATIMVKLVRFAIFEKTGGAN